MIKKSEMLDVPPGAFYLAGPMSSVPNWNIEGFADAAKALREKGYKVINPHDLHDTPPAWSADATLDAGWEDTWLEYLAVDLPVVLQCEGIVMLPGWENSRGARLEWMVAALSGKVICFYDRRLRTILAGDRIDNITAGLMVGAADVIADIVGRNSVKHGGHVEWQSRTPQYHAHKVAGHAVLAAAQLGREVGAQPDGEDADDHLQRCLVRAAMGLSRMATLDV